MIGQQYFVARILGRCLSLSLWSPSMIELGMIVYIWILIIGSGDLVMAHFHRTAPTYLGFVLLIDWKSTSFTCT